MKNKYTVKELSELLKVSKPTVQRAIKELKIEPVEIVKNKFRYYSQQDAENIVKAVIGEDDLNFSQFFATSENTETPQNVSQNTENEPQNVSQSGRTHRNTENISNDNEAIKTMLSMLQKEIEKKDQMINDLQNRLDNAYIKIADMADKAQYIAAADKTVLLMDKKQQMDDDSSFDKDVVENEHKEPEGNIFTRLFRRKK